MGRHFFIGVVLVMKFPIYILQCNSQNLFCIGGLKSIIEFLNSNDHESDPLGDANFCRISSDGNVEENLYIWDHIELEYKIKKT